MPLFWKPYKSEITQFLDELKSAKPTLEREQQAGRALLWDKELDPEWQAQFKAGKVSQAPYVYQPRPSK